jgi:peptidoglycan/xylan/chitin deacetylase (PgdA/CDA1 family)
MVRTEVSQREIIARSGRLVSMSMTFVFLSVGIMSMLLAAAGIYYATYAVRSQWLGSTDWHGREDMGAVALTFDDGPAADTERILDILAERNVCATFFMIGRHVEDLPQAARRVATEGHEIGNHSYSHPIYLYRDSSATRRQLERAQAVITETTGVTPRLARPPCGVRTPAYFAATRSLRLRTVQWDVAGFDWKRRSAKQIADEVLHRVRAGSIILLHDGDSEGKRDRRETVAALPLIIDGLHARGLRIVPLAQLLGEKEVKIAA